MKNFKVIALIITLLLFVSCGDEIKPQYIYIYPDNHTKGSVDEDIMIDSEEFADNEIQDKHQESNEEDKEDNAHLVDKGKEPTNKNNDTTDNEEEMQDDSEPEIIDEGLEEIQDEEEEPADEYQAPENYNFYVANENGGEEHNFIIWEMLRAGGSYHLSLGKENDYTFKPTILRLKFKDLGDWLQPGSEIRPEGICFYTTWDLENEESQCYDSTKTYDSFSLEVIDRTFEDIIVKIKIPKGISFKKYTRYYVSQKEWNHIIKFDYKD